MEVKEFRDSREAELSAFQKKYDVLKQEYSSALSSAIQEKDVSKQDALIRQVKQVNKQLIDEIRDILAILNKGKTSFDYKTLDELTDELIKYQAEYQEIEKTNDRVNTLKLIKSNTLSKLDSQTWSYYLYISILILLCFYIVYLIISASWSQSLVGASRGAIGRLK
jgi:hypothetical protein